MSPQQAAAIRDEVLDLARALIRRPSVTPDDAGCQALLGERLAGAGFAVEHLRFGEVDNLWARHGHSGPVLVLLGHTDVVPPGPEEAWQHPPFAAAVDGDMLWGRGAADMKGSVAAMTIAAEHFVRTHPHHDGSLAVMLTSDEEGPALDGIRRVVPWLADRGEAIDYCIVGEPSCSKLLGDTIRVGRRGTLSADLVVQGVQGHVAYPEHARNPLHELAPALVDLTSRRWDDGDADFPPTSFQVSNLQAGTGADNVIPGEARVQFNFRYGPVQSADDLQQQVMHILDRHGLDHRITWRHGGEPFRTPAGKLRTAMADVIREVTGLEPAESTAGGTSDGRFIAPGGAQVVEFGPCNNTIHQIDERVAIEDLASTALIHYRLARSLLG